MNLFIFSPCKATFTCRKQLPPSVSEAAPTRTKMCLDSAMKGDPKLGQDQVENMGKTASGSSYLWYHDNCPLHLPWRHQSMPWQEDHSLACFLSACRHIPCRLSRQRASFREDYKVDKADFRALNQAFISNHCTSHT